MRNGWVEYRGEWFFSVGDYWLARAWRLSEYRGEWFFSVGDYWLARAWRLSDDVGGGWRAEWLRGYTQPKPTLAEAQKDAEDRIRAYRDSLSAALALTGIG